MSAETMREAAEEARGILVELSEFVPLPRWTAGELQPLVTGHLRAHLEQARQTLRVRGALPEAVGR